MKDKEKCCICNKDITTELPKVDVNGNHYCSDCYIHKCKTELKEKQIEEMAKALLEYIKVYGKLHLRVDGIDNTARLFAKFGITKLPENSVVLSREELEKIINQTKETEKNYYKKVVIPQERKETAENYKVSMMLSIQEMQKYLEITEEQAKILYQHNYQVAKQFDVEIKE